DGDQVGAGFGGHNYLLVEDAAATDCRGTARRLAGWRMSALCETGCKGGAAKRAEAEGGSCLDSLGFVLTDFEAARGQWLRAQNEAIELRAILRRKSLLAREL